MKYLIQKLRIKLFAEKHNGRKYYFGGVLPDKEDPRQLKMGASLFGYTPTKPVCLLKTLDYKNQNFNTCVQEATTGRAEAQEGVVLSEQGLTIAAKKEGAISGDGFSSLVGIQKVECKKGIPEKSLLNDDDFSMSFDSYSNPNRLTPTIAANALVHCGKNFVEIIGRSARLKALESGERLLTAMDWYHGYNMGGGFSAPWVISKPVGAKVGGHAFYLKGFALNYKGIENKKIITGAGGRDVYAVQQSAGPTWGATVVDDNGVEHKGMFFIDMDFFDKYGSPTYQRIDFTTANIKELIDKYESKQVKASAPGIYKIEDGKKRGYPNKVTFYSDGGLFGKDGKTYEDVATSLLDNIPDGDPINIVQTKHWDLISDKYPLIQALAEPQSLKVVKDAIDEQKAIEEAYENRDGKTLLDKLILSLSNMANKGKYGALSSSANPQQLSLTIKNILVGLIPLTITLLGAANVSIDPQDLMDFINTAFAAISAVGIFVGVGRKIYYAIKNK